MIFAWAVATGAALAAVILAVLLIRARRRGCEVAAENGGLRLRADELAAASHARSRFLAMMSHEIRTPLAGIVGFAEVVGDEALSPAGRRAADNIQRASRSLQALLGDILDFSRIDAGALPMQRVPTDLEALLNEVREEFAPQARLRGLAFGLTVADDARRWTLSDPLRLRQIVVNLVSNAIRYTEAGMVRVTAAAAPADADTIVIRVTDTGLGIAPEERRRIFDAFAQATDGEATRGEGGVGLGLAIAEGLVRSMGGTIAVDSTLGEGSTFTVSLPLPPCPPQRLAPATTAAPAAPARILLVDDVEMNREMFAAMLAKAGHQVTTAEDGEAALQRLRAAAFDLAFIDLQMPFMDGIELTRRIRADEDPAIAGLPIVALSAAAYGEDRDRAEAAGMNDYVTKPATRDDVAAAVARVLAARPLPAPRSEPPAGPPTGPLPAPPPETETLDRAMFDEQRATFGDDRTQRFLAMLSEELDRRTAALADARREADRGALARHVHSVASAAGNLGFMPLVTLCRSLERTIAEMSADELGAALDEIEEAIASARGTIGDLSAEITAGRADRRASG